MAVTESWTPEQIAEFERCCAEHPEHRHRIVNPPQLTPDEVRQLLRECVTVVRPGEVLILRCPENWSPEQAYEMQQRGAYWLAVNAPEVKVMVVPHLGMAVIEGNDDH